MITWKKWRWGTNPVVYILAVAFGVLSGLGGYTFLYAEGLSYFSTDPLACANCHIMQHQYDSWTKSSHKSVARCVDCHLPKDHAETFSGIRQ